jgi:hypothetical protein
MAKSYRSAVEKPSLSRWALHSSHPIPHTGARTPDFGLRTPASGFGLRSLVTGHWIHPNVSSTLPAVTHLLTSSPQSETFPIHSGAKIRGIFRTFHIATRHRLPGSWRCQPRNDLEHRTGTRTGVPPMRRILAGRRGILYYVQGPSSNTLPRLQLPRARDDAPRGRTGGDLACGGFDATSAAARQCGLAKRAGP